MSDEVRWEDIISSKDAAGILNTSQQYVVMLIGQGRLRAKKVANVWLVSQEEVERFNASRR